MKCTVCDGSGRTPSPTGVPMIVATSCAGCFGTGCGPAPSTPGEGTPARDVAEAVDSCPGCEAPLWPDNLTSCWNCGQALIDYGPKFRTPPPGEGAGRPLPEFQMVACADHMLTGHRWRCRACRREVERQFQECCEEMWRLQRTTPAPPASPVPPTRPLILDDGEVTLTAEGDGYVLTVQINEAGDSVSHRLTAAEVAAFAAVPPTRPGADAVIRALIAACPSYGRGEGDTFHIEESAVVRMAREFLAVAPPTPAPCPYIVTGGEGTSHCSLAERSAMHAAAPPSTPAEQPEPDGGAA